MKLASAALPCAAVLAFGVTLPPAVMLAPPPSLAPPALSKPLSPGKPSLIPRADTQTVPRSMTNIPRSYFVFGMQSWGKMTKFTDRAGHTLALPSEAQTLLSDGRPPIPQSLPVRRFGAPGAPPPLTAP